MSSECSKVISGVISVISVIHVFHGVSIVIYMAKPVYCDSTVLSGVSTVLSDCSHEDQVMESSF